MGKIKATNHLRSIAFDVRLLAEDIPIYAIIIPLTIYINVY